MKNRGFKHLLPHKCFHIVYKSISRHTNGNMYDVAISLHTVSGKFDYFCANMQQTLYLAAYRSATRKGLFKVTSPYPPSWNTVYFPVG